MIVCDDCRRITSGRCWRHSTITVPMTPSQAAQEKSTRPRTVDDLLDAVRIILINEVPSDEAWRDLDAAYDAAMAEREAAAATPSLDRDLLAEAIFESGVRQTMSQSEQAADNILAEIPIILARLDEGSATPREQSDD